MHIITQKERYYFSLQQALTASFRDGSDTGTGA
jgi:hypothetical protein